MFIYKICLLDIIQYCLYFVDSQSVWNKYWCIQTSVFPLILSCLSHAIVLFCRFPLGSVS